MNTVALPFSYFYYETEEDKDFKTRFCLAFRNWIIFLIIFCCIHFPLYTQLRHSFIPVDAKTYNVMGENSQQMSSVFLDLDDERVWFPNSDQIYNQTEGAELDMQLTFAAYTIASTTFLGSFLSFLFLGTGLIAIPFEQITSWADRPKPMNESQFKKAKDGLARQVEFLLKEGKSIYEKKTKLDAEKENSRFLTKFKYWSQSRKLDQGQQEFEANCVLVEKEFEKLT